MKKIVLVSIAGVIIVGLFLYFTVMKRSADFIITNATVYTVDEHNSVQQAIAVRGNKIVGVGTTQDIQNQFTSQKTIDARGMTVIPGMIDSHGHVLGLGESLTELDLVGTTSEQQIAEMVKARAEHAKNGEWIRGRGWDQNDWGSGTGAKPFPTNAALDRVAPNNPVILERIDGHAVWVNSKAMEIAGIKTDEKTVVDGGRIVRGADGLPTGIFIDNADNIIYSSVPEYTREEKKGMILKALRYCLACGLTSVGDMGINEENFEIYKELDQEGMLPVRIYALVGGTGRFWERMKKEGPYINQGDGMLTLRSIKLYMDGALGSRGAALLEPYSDDPDNSGLLVSDPDTIERVTEEALQHGFQVCTHAIGDKANRFVLDAYERAEHAYPQQAQDARLRIEHAQVISPEDIPRFKQLNVIPSMQPTHATSDMYWAEARLGADRIRGAYAWRSLLDDGNIIPGGSDFPVELPNPLDGFYAAVTRQDKAGIPQSADDVRKGFQLSSDGIRDTNDFNGGWYVHQRMSRDEALHSFTAWGAYAQFAENQIGSIETGKRADIVILSTNIMKVEPKDILTTAIEMTIVDGKIQYQKSSGN